MNHIRTFKNISRNKGLIEIVFVLLFTLLLLASCHAEETAADTVHPQIIGAHDIHYTRGRPLPDLLKDVSATDDVDGEIPVEVDDSAVDFDELGEYSIVYKARDRAGNYAQKTVKVYVDGYRGDQVTTEAVEAIADEVLAEILTDGMTNREKAEAIHDWIAVHMTYLPTPEVVDSIGKLPQAAYIGFTEGNGNCYTLYAMGEILLTRAGIPNIPISNKDPEHYWSLVKVDGEWLHFNVYAGQPDRGACCEPDESMLGFFGGKMAWTYDPADMEEWEGID
ncbi:MAG: hypothetical protein IKQ87_01105 [Clostridia bacterium]|nr:hypothetical protein [Clostridia bacterium]